MRKTFSKITAILVIFIMSMSFVTFADQKPITVFLDGEQLTFDVEPTLESGRTLVPMRVIFEALGATVNWDNDTFTAIAVKDDLTIKITIDDMKLYKNDEVIELDVPARLINGRTLVPARAVSEGMGAKVDWDQENWKVIITTKEVEAPKKYDFNQLSEADREKLDQSITGIRYSFEQYVLPSMIFNDEIKASIKGKTSYIREAVDYAWWANVADAVINIQMSSDSEYNFDDIVSDEEFLDGYIELVEKSGYMYKNFFSMDFENTPSGKSVFLLEFKEAVPSMTVPCKYIGIIVDNDNKLRYFTAETDFMTNDKYFLCEVFEKGGRGSIGLIDMDKKSFLSAIDKQIK